MADFSYDIIKKGLDAASIRQKSISSNIANVNTPGFKAGKVEFESELRKAIGNAGVSMKKTHENHLGGTDISSVSPKVVKSEEHSMNENGNNVDIDREMVDLAANEIYYSALIEQLNRKLSNMSYVINR
ncbi:flagellar basal body rod protein FlgB [Alkalibacter mobilis]|uniref:flagellar basal body rod protein FlgB n=1 Tax=Alkalibacter mobilis TaxID=2787712 RepID=UPI0018A0B1E4|nr:flagellar basal body rod protein FlgB [Alkalibacter mobilis]MBF7096327.1 flagellar basal body rod protein FlgB [Alkalibacter mobilis]